MKYVSLVFLVGVLLTLIGFTKSRHRSFNLGVNMVALTAIYVLTLIFGPAKYTIDLQRSPIVYQDKNYLFAWEVNPVLPFSHFVRPVALTASEREVSKNDVYQASSQFARDNGWVYQPYPFVKQYLFYVLLVAWLVVYRCFVRKGKVSDKQEKLTREKIAACQSLAELRAWQAGVEKLPFYRALHKKRMREALAGRVNSLTQELTLSFYAVAKHLYHKSNLSNESVQPFAILPLWLAKMMKGGEYQFALDVDVIEGSDYQMLGKMLNYFQQQKKENSDELEYKKIWEDKQLSQSRQREIEAKVTKSLETALKGILPPGLVTFSQDAPVRIKLEVKAQDLPRDKIVIDNYISLVKGNDSYLYLSPAYGLLLSVEGSSKKFVSVKQTLREPLLSDLSSDYINKNGSIKIVNIDNGKSIPKYCLEMLKAKLVTSVMQVAIANVPPSEGSNRGNLAAAESVESLYMELANEIKGTVAEETAAEAVDLAIDALLNSDSPHVQRMLDGIALGAVALGIQEDIFSELAVTLLTEATASAFVSSVGA